MVLFALLTITLIFLVLFLIFAVAIGGAAFIVVFADVIVCACIIAWIMKVILKRRKNKK